MNSAPLLFLGILATLAGSFWGLLLAPQLQIGRQESVELKTGELYPLSRSGLARQGAEVYRAYGCVECHTQQIRAGMEWAGGRLKGYTGSDIERGWGARFTVAQDYIQDYPVLLGSQRIGPDLANIGARRTNALWHLNHLYDPKSTAPGSMMPPYRFLFEKRSLKLGELPSPDALPAGDAAAGYQILPRPKATALVAYLLSLRAEAPLFEAPLPGSATNTVEAAVTNAPAAPTNPPATPK
jgi:cytochrome c oxidase cbb3-type subunit 2